MGQRKQRIIAIAGGKTVCIVVVVVVCKRIDLFLRHRVTLTTLLLKHGAGPFLILQFSPFALVCIMLLCCIGCVYYCSFFFFIKLVKFLVFSISLCMVKNRQKSIAKNMSVSTKT